MKDKNLNRKAQDVANNSTVIEETVNELVSEIENLEKDIEDLEEEIYDLKNEIQTLKEVVKQRDITIDILEQHQQEQ